jgi:hypothetical protein
MEHGDFEKMEVESAAAYVMAIGGHLRPASTPQRRRSRAPDPVTASTLEWLARASLFMLRL